MSKASGGKSKVCYFYDTEIGSYYYGQGHPMKPHRIRMTHNLLLNYGLYRKMEIYRPSPGTFEELRKFHSEDYMRFLRAISPDNMGEYTKQMQRCAHRPPPPPLRACVLHDTRAAPRSQRRRGLPRL